MVTQWEGCRLDCILHAEAALAIHRYTIILEPDNEEGGYTVSVPALPGVVTQGETVEEAIEMAKDAIKLYLDVLKERGEPIPVEHKRPQTITVDVAA